MQEVVDRLAVTPMYICPELSRFFLARSGKSVASADIDTLISRKMDVWTIGLIGLELIFKQPVFEPFFDQFVNDKSDDVDSFYQLLEDPAKVVIDEDMRQYVSKN